MPNTFDLQQFNISRPEKMRWRFNLVNNEVLASIKSKSTRNFLKKIPEILEKNAIKYEFVSLELEQYLSWLSFYREKMQENKYEVLATEDWFTENQQKGHQLFGLFFYQDHKMVGGGIIKVSNQQLATLSFKASERMDLSSQTNSNFGSIIDYLFLQTMVEKGITTISGGQSRNAFGVINTLGYLDYKLRFGYLPQVPPKAELITTVPLNEEGWVLFYGLKNDQLSLFAITSNEYQGTFEVARFSTPDLPFEHLRYN
jgi:hypothetical protein